jgi:hypothetical protein
MPNWNGRHAFGGQHAIAIPSKRQSAAYLLPWRRYKTEYVAFLESYSTNHSTVTSQ